MPAGRVRRGRLLPVRRYAGSSPGTGSSNSPDLGHLIETADTTPDVRTPQRVTPQPPEPTDRTTDAEPTDRTADPRSLSPTHPAQEPLFRLFGSMCGWWPICRVLVSGRTRNRRPETARGPVAAPGFPASGRQPPDAQAPGSRHAAPPGVLIGAIAATLDRYRGPRTPHSLSEAPRWCPRPRGSPPVPPAATTNPSSHCTCPPVCGPAADGGCRGCGRGLGVPLGGVRPGRGLAGRSRA